MRCVPPFRSSIPKAAQERIISQHANGAKAQAEYALEGKVVGIRCFDHEGNLEFDGGLRDGRSHGTAYRLDTPGRLLSATPYAHGVEHGMARQWSNDGRLIGTYRMHRGTGIDLWWNETCDTHSCRPYLAEVHFMERGEPHGYEWWINDDQASVHAERYWSEGRLHGIEREWNLHGRLHRGFPKYYVAGQQVTRRRYLRARTADASLPNFRKEENSPHRLFPAGIAQQLCLPERGEHPLVTTARPPSPARPG